MYCPECRAEYVEGILECSDCRVELVEELSEEPKPEFVEYIEVLSTFNPGDIAFLESVLESEDIDHFFKGGNFVHVYQPVEPAKLMIRADQAGRAIDLLKDAGLSISGINIHKESRDS